MHLNDIPDIFINRMAKLHCEHLQQDIDHFLISTSEKMVDKTEILQEMVDKANSGRKTGRYYSFHGRQRRNQNRAACHSIGLDRTAKRYLRQLTEFGYLEAHGGNRNKSYTRK